MAINQDIFFDDQDRQEYLERVKRYKDELEFILYAYVLMANHVHLLMETPYASISKIMQRISLTYTQYFNKKYGKVGHLFQGRYKVVLAREVLVGVSREYEYKLMDLQPTIKRDLSVLSRLSKESDHGHARKAVEEVIRNLNARMQA